jgi:hypothetical protein
MPALLAISLALNVVVLVPVCIGLIRNATWVDHALGPRQPARQILLAVYLSILLLSLLLLLQPRPDAAFGLLAAQVIYKVISPWSVGTWRNPVVLSNLAIAAVHAVTIASLWRA